MQLLLIDNRVNDVQTVTDSLLENVDYVIFDFDNDTRESVIAKIPVKIYESIGIFQENYDTDSYQFLRSFTVSTLTNISSEDPNLDTWSDYKSLLSYFKTTLGINTIDLMGCSININQNWDYVIEHLGNELQININSSNDNTGSSNLGGNWILESNNTNLIGKYFSNNITNYQFILGVSLTGTVVMARDYKLYSCGNNPYSTVGIFSDEFKNQYTNFTLVPNVSGNYTYFGANDNAFLLYADGSLFGTGLNTSGQLGLGHRVSITVFTKIYNPVNNSGIKCIAVDCGVGHIVYVLSDGSVWASGLNTSGQLGTGNNTLYTAFTKVYNPENNSNIKCTALACGDSHTLYLLADGSVWGTGNNTNGCLGTGNQISRNTFIKTWPNAEYPTIACIKLRTARGSTPHTHIIGSDGAPRAVGSNGSRQIYEGAALRQLNWRVPFTADLFYSAESVADVVCTSTFTAYVLSSGLLIKTINTKDSFIQINYNDGPIKPTELSVGYNSETFVWLLNDGSVMGQGNNNNGQLGTNNTTAQANPIKIYDPTLNSNIKCVSTSNSGIHTVLVLEDGSVRCAGVNNLGQLGDGTILTAGIRRTFRTLYNPSLNSGLKCIKAYTLFNTTILLMANGTLRTTGTNALGQMGINNGINNRLQYTNINDAQYISIGGNEQFSVILKSDGSVWGKGKNDGGQFAGGSGLGDITSFNKVYDPATNTNKKCVAISTGDAAGPTVLLLDDGSTMFTGVNGDGQLGTGITSGNRLSFEASYNPATNGNIKCSKISQTGGFGYILLENGSVMAAGNNGFGQLGLGDTTRRMSWTTIYTPANGLTCTNIYAIGSHGFYILSDGSLWGAGRNNTSQLGLGNTTQQNSFVKIYDPETNSNIACVSCITATGFTLILLSDGSVRATGSNTYGAFGNGTKTSTTTFQTIYNPATNSNIKCRALYAGEGGSPIGQFSQLLLTDGTVLIAGTNTFGLLGLGNVTEQLTFTKMLKTDGTIMTDVYQLADSYLYSAPFVIPDSPTITSINSVSPKLQSPTISISFTQSLVDATITNYSYSSDGTTYTECSPAQFTSPLVIPVTSLSSGTTYTFSIKAVNSAGSSNASVGVSATVYFPPEKPTITSITAYNQSAIVNFTQPASSTSVTNYAYSYSIYGGSSSVFNEFTLLNPATTTSPFTISGLTNNSIISVKIRSFNDDNGINKYSEDSNVIYNKRVYVSEPIICFRDDTKILTSNGYIPIRNLKEGDLVETFSHGLKPITVIGKTEIIHEAIEDRVPDQLYKYCKTEDNGLIEDLIITGRHAILVDEFVSDEQKQSVLKMYGIIKKTDNKYHLPAAVDNNSVVHEIPGQYTVYHLALQNDNENMNYGIYANGLLVESCSNNYLKSQISMLQ